MLLACITGQAAVPHSTTLLRVLAAPLALFGGVVGGAAQVCLVLQRRVGLAVRYMAPDVRHTAPPPASADQRTMVTLVGGSSSGGGQGVCAEFELESAPSVALGDVERARHGAAMGRERDRYFARPIGQPEAAEGTVAAACVYK